ncbi:MAG: hypothetical protein US89_C0016G0037 [Candidatus Peregrinibacteria bacterium GW2011_GWF2_38_29]|nr:MAG: hypothetical protein US89_C0016G0037 [Candidatus Peregrinibacteria bacterium GW2011_GWF2_38_29]HBB03149.1 hypothetical protein [Candidatus Peregrinibacteria bacterium]
MLTISTAPDISHASSPGFEQAYLPGTLPTGETVRYARKMFYPDKDGVRGVSGATRDRVKRSVFGSSKKKNTIPVVDDLRAASVDRALVNRHDVLKKIKSLQRALKTVLAAKSIGGKRTDKLEKAEKCLKRRLVELMFGKKAYSDRHLHVPAGTESKGYVGHEKRLSGYDVLSARRPARNSGLDWFDAEEADAYAREKMVVPSANEIAFAMDENERYRLEIELKQMEAHYGIDHDEAVSVVLPTSNVDAHDDGEVEGVIDDSDSVADTLGGENIDVLDLMDSDLDNSDDGDSFFEDIELLELEALYGHSPEASRALHDRRVANLDSAIEAAELVVTPLKDRDMVLDLDDAMRSVRRAFKAAKARMTALDIAFEKGEDKRHVRPDAVSLLNRSGLSLSEIEDALWDVPSGRDPVAMLYPDTDVEAASA